MTETADTTYNEPKEVPRAVSSSVERWCERVRKARDHWSKDFKRMRKNMDFVSGYQWEGQEEVNDERYVSNLTLRLMRQKVAALYARNPTIVAQRRRRMDFQIWDGRLESLQQAVAVSMSPEAKPEDLISAGALLMDYVRGRQQRDVVDKVGATLQHMLTWALENQTPEFKEQCKQMVRRAVVTGVAYIRLHFEREGTKHISTINKQADLQDRALQAQAIINRIARGEIDEDSPEYMRLQTLLTSNYGVEMENEQVQERLTFDFPQATAIIPDKKTRSLKGFVGARWIAQEYLMTYSEIEEHFGVDVGYQGKSTTHYSAQGEAQSTDPTMEDPDDCYACVWEVFDKRAGTKFFICDGYDEYLEEPTAMWPEFRNFWPIMALTFNETEIEGNCSEVKASIFPPSDVDVARAPQREWNKSREELKKHRNANRPRYGFAAGTLTPEDQQRLADSQPNEVIEFKGVQPGGDVGKVVRRIEVAPIDPGLYDTSPLVQDLSAALGNEEATTPASGEGTATASTINEQNRMVTTASDVDDLDSLLSCVAEAAGEILLREASPETVQRIVGIGAVWPVVDRAEYTNYIYLTILASSSGRPNKALEIANFQQIAPILLQAGASPHFIIREAIKRLDDRLDPDEVFPFGPGQASMAVPMTPQPADSTGQPSRGRVAPTQQGQQPAGTVPRSKIERPQLTQ